MESARIFLARNWSPAFKEWSTKAARDAFFASPKFPRLLNGDVVKDTILRGVENGLLGYVGKKSDGSYSPFHWQASMVVGDIEISDDMYIIQRDVAEAYRAGKSTPPPTSVENEPTPEPAGSTPMPSTGGPADVVAPVTSSLANIVWSGEIPAQKWMNF